ncbi:MAG: hypothetical protein JZU59_17080 [Chromatium okenii]|nr:hypothetical protein [Chromatium okenii]
MMRGTLALVIAGFTAMLGWQWQSWPPPLITPNVATGAEVNLPVPNEPLPLQMSPQPDHEQYAELLERPLFRPDRKPEPPPDAPAEPSAAPEMNADLNTLDLTAVMLTPSLISAWVRDPAQPTLRRLRLGDEVHGWTVQKISEDQVILVRADEEHSLTLRDYSQSPPPPAAPAPPKTAHRPPAPSSVPTRRQLPRPPSPPPAPGR